MSTNNNINSRRRFEAATSGAFKNFLSGVGNWFSNVYSAPTSTGGRLPGARNPQSQGQYFGPAYMDTTPTKRGLVGGGNAGASTANQWPAYLKGPGSVAPVFPGTSPPGSSGSSNFNAAAAERNYQAEKIRAAQLAEQDQLSKKYRIADLTKAYNAATGDEKQKIGLEIWATTNPELAKKLSPGQTGYSQAVSAFQSSSPIGTYTRGIGNTQYANNLDPASLNAPMVGFDIKTPVTGISVPQGIDKVGITENFSNASPFLTEALTDPLKFYKPNLSNNQQAMIRYLFERGLK